MKIDMTRRAALAAMILALGFAVQQPGLVDAKAGVLARIERPAECFGGHHGVGVTITAHSSQISYTCQLPGTLKQSSRMFVTDLLGMDGGGFPSQHDADGHEIPLHAIVWDGQDGVFWGADQIPLSATTGEAICAVWRVDVGVAFATLAFTFEEPDGGCDLKPGVFMDGIALDPETNTLYVSTGNARRIRHFHKDGTPAEHDAIDFQALTESTCAGGCLNSGLAFGADGTLLAATGTSGKLIRIDPGSGQVIDVYRSAAGRDWGLSCGPPIVDPSGRLVRTVLSADLMSSFINVLEAPAGFCDPYNFVVRDLRVPERLHGLVGETTDARISVEAGSFGPMLDDETLFTVRLAALVPPARFIVHPGDTCLIFGTYRGYQAIPCTEGDVAGWFPGKPSVGNDACEDGVDGDGDGATDASDCDCLLPIKALDVPVPTGIGMRTVKRTLVLYCDGTVNDTFQLYARPVHERVHDFNIVDDYDAERVTVMCE